MNALSPKKIYGHEVALSALGRLLDSGKVPHALLFCGPDGVGKRMVARAFAAARLCERPRGLTACGECVSCLSLLAGHHTDYYEAEAEKDRRSIGIDEIKELKKYFGLRPSTDGGKIAVIDGADAMTPDAQNALLKLLEEPPAGSVMILVTGRHRELLATVLSRCRRIEFGPMERDVQTRLLVETGGLSAVEAEAVAPLSDGSLSRAVYLAKNSGPALYDRALDMLEHFADGDTVEMEEKSSQDREEDECFVELIAQVLRDLMRIKAGSRAGLFAPANQERLERLAAHWEPDALLKALERAGEAREALTHSGNTRIIFDQLWISLGARLL